MYFNIYGAKLLFPFKLLVLYIYHAAFCLSYHLHTCKVVLFHIFFLYLSSVMQVIIGDCIYFNTFVICHFLTCPVGCVLLGRDLLVLWGEDKNLILLVTM